MNRCCWGLSTAPVHHPLADHHLMIMVMMVVMVVIVVVLVMMMLTTTWNVNWLLQEGHSHPSSPGSLATLSPTQASWG